MAHLTTPLNTYQFYATLYFHPLIGSQMQQKTFMHTLKTDKDKESVIDKMLYHDTYSEVSLNSVVDNWTGAIELFHHVVPRKEQGHSTRHIGGYSEVIVHETGQSSL